MAKDVLSGAEIECVIEAHAGSYELSDDEHDSMVRFARAILAAAEPAITAEALEQAAKVCDDKERRKWHILTEGGALEGFGPLDCAHAIRQLGAGSKGDDHG